MALKVNEIFYSLQGESSSVGEPTGFVRLTGCNLRCVYCDTRYAYEEGAMMALSEILHRLRELAARRVLLTGGEPLLQPETPALATLLLDAGLTVEVETNGSLDIDALPKGCRRIMDWKTPGSGMRDRMRRDNLERLKAGDELKLVIMDENDYLWARGEFQSLRLGERAPVVFSPVWGRLAPDALAAWILRDRLPVRMIPQLHKYIWPGVERGV